MLHHYNVRLRTIYFKKCSTTPTIHTHLRAYTTRRRVHGIISYTITYVMHACSFFVGGGHQYTDIMQFSTYDDPGVMRNPAF